MKKVLFYGDFLRPTGFGNVMENIIERAMKEFDVEVIGINHNGQPYNKVGNPYYKFKDIPVMPAECNGDMFGKAKLLGMLIENNYDTVFILQDLFNILPIVDEIKSIKERKGFKLVLYFPIDGKPKEVWKQVIEMADVAVSYTHWANEQINRNLRVIYHGVDKMFKPIDKSIANQFRRDYLNIDENKFLITNINRNQPRKDFARTIMAYDIFQRETLNSVLYLHCNWHDAAGIDIDDFILHNYPHLKGQIIKPKYTLDKEALNILYNATDLLVSTTLGEGWGLSTTEAMSCETPVLMPDSTVNREIIGESRGYLAKAGSNPSLWVANLYDNEILRPIVDVEDMAAKMSHIYNNKDEAKIKAANAREWVKENCNWDDICEEWNSIL